jgi:type VI secretion system secreted protein VgrG
MQQLLNETGLTNFDVGLVGQYGRIEFEMMYDESPGAFVSRLMERDGIHYHFREGNPAETLVIGDANAIFTPVGTSLTYYGHLANPGAGVEFIATFQRNSSLFTGNAAAGGYDFTRPALNILWSASSGGGIGEKFEFASEITAVETARFRAQVNLQRELVHRQRCLGMSNAPALRAGHVFSLVDESGAGFGDIYLVTEIRHIALIDEGSGCLVYANSFSAIPSSVTFRPERKTPMPKVPGVVTAIVTGSAGETRYVDEYGRIKVRFLWDRYGANDEHSSAWIRVMIPSGRLDDTPTHLFIPEVGSEVVVSFLQGNPSLPVVLGSIYNGVFMPPLVLPDNK